MWEYVGWPEYVTAIFLCTSGFVAVNWMCFHERMASTTLRKLEPHLDALNRSKSGWEKDKDDVDLGFDWAKMLKLSDQF